MDYSDIFTRPIEEITDDEIIQRARELREKGRYPVIVKTPVDKKPKAKKKWLKSFKKVPRLQGRIPVLVDLISPEEIEITLAPESLETDVVAVSALSALAVQLEGFCNDQVLVRCRNHPVFVEISGPQRILKITAPVIYIFTGSFSLRDDKI